MPKAKKRRKLKGSVLPLLSTGIDQLARGGFTTAFTDGKGNLLTSRLEMLVAQLLRFQNIPYEYQSRKLGEKKTYTPSSFQTRAGVMYVIEEIDDLQVTPRIAPSKLEKRSALISSLKLASRFQDLGVPVISLDGSPAESRRRQAIFLDDPSFAFDYSHILPPSEKCSVLHGHTSAVLLEIVGQPKEDGMIVEFGELKRRVRSVLGALDHKLFISRKYVVKSNKSSSRIRFSGLQGDFDLTVPTRSLYLIEGEATTENLSREVLKVLAPKMPPAVEALGVYIYEGLNKGSHLLASLSSREK